MYMQDERHSSSDLNSRHQQTIEPSYLQTHWQPMNKPKSQTTDSDDAHTKPSQTENSWMQTHNKIQNKLMSNLERGPSCSCHSSRSKSADSPPVRIPRCQCQSKAQPGHSRGQPCGTQPQQAKYKKTDSTRTSITESETSTNKSSFTDILKTCTCGSRPPYWAGQSNVVSGPSYSRAMQSGSSKNTSYQSSRSRQPRGRKPRRSKSLTSVEEEATDYGCNQSAMTWVSRLQSDRESEDCPPLQSDRECEDCPPMKSCLGYSDKQTETSTITFPKTTGYNDKQMETSTTSFPTSQATTSRYPYNQPSFGVDVETSATTRSRSIVGKVTCLCPPGEEFPKKPPGTGACLVSNQDAPCKCTCATDYQDAEGTSQGICEPCSSDTTSSSDQGVSGATFKGTCATDFQDVECTSQGVSARIQHPPSSSQYIEADTSRYMESDSTTGVQKKPSSVGQTAKSVTKFCDCHSPSSRSSSSSITTCPHRGSDPIQTSYHSHRSLSDGSCLCNVDEPDNKSPCDTKDCQCQKDVDENDPMCSCHTQGSAMKTPEDFCGSICQACATRKERVLRLVEELSDPNACDCSNDRASKIQQLFRELTLLLRSESEGAVAPTEEEPCSDPLPFEECCTAQHERAGAKDCEQPLSKKELQRVECFHQLEEYLRKCFLPPGEPKVPETDIYGFEMNPDFSPDGVVECSSTSRNRSSAQFYDLGDGCSGDGIGIKPPSCTCCNDGDVFQDCEGGDEIDDEENVRHHSQNRDGKNGYGENGDGENGDGEDGDGENCDPCAGDGDISKCESDDLCDQLKTFVEKELQDIEASAKGSLLEVKSPEVILKELCEGSTITVPAVKPVPCEKEEKSEVCVCPFAGMEAVSPWTDPNKDKPPYPYNLPIDPSVQKEPAEDPFVGEPRGLLPPGPLPEDVRELCERLIRKALKDCGLCPSIDTTCEECEECLECNDEECPEECPEEYPCESPDECLEEFPQKCQQGCLCCHCRALICDEECKTVSKTLRSATCDPLCEMKYFIDSMIIDLHAMDCVLGTKQAKPKDIRANDASRKPNASFPVTISNVTSLGCTSLFVQWEVADCRAIAGYEIYVDGHLTNRFYSFRHHAGVVTNVDVNNPHQIVLRAQAVGQEFPGEGPGPANKDGSCCQAVAPAHPEMAAGSERPWSPSVFYYDPNAPEGEIKC